ncbi:hypothetical protein FIBSPDRAFT_730502, partial [Athelia psychrophila]
QLSKGADMARGDDTSTLKAMIIVWVHELFGPSVPGLITTCKDGRGFYNVHTERLLCPGEYDWDSEEARTAICAGDEEFVVTAESWPRFCYANFSYDPEDVDEGLWQSALMVKTFKCIFMSPSSAIDKKDPEEPATKRHRTTKPSVRKNVASKIGLTSVTG